MSLQILPPYFRFSTFSKEISLPDQRILFKDNTLLLDFSKNRINKHVFNELIKLAKEANVEVSLITDNDILK